MAVLQKIRVKFGLAISIIIAIALLSFIIDPSTLESAWNSMSSKYNVGEIAGKAISYQNFQEEVDAYTTVHEIMTGSTVKDDAAQKQIRNAAWQGLIDKNLFIKNAKAAGINVGEAEMTDLCFGDMASPIIAQNYMFMDEAGNFSPDKAREFASTLGDDQTGRAKAYWDYLVNGIKTQQYYSKYFALFTAGDVENPLMLRKAIEENNTTSNVDFVMVPFGYEVDSTIVISDNEIKNYYNSHKKFYKQQESRDIEYVVYEVIPSAKDIADVNDKMIEVYDEFCTTSNMKSFLSKNSERAYSEYWYKKGELANICADIDEYAFGAGSDKPSTVINVDNSFYAARVMAKANVSDSVFVKHILLQGDDAKTVAEQILGEIKGGKNFADLVAMYSVDTNSAAEGEPGAIGWMTQTYMIPGFESVINAEINRPQILKTQYGTHVVMVTRKTNPIEKKQVAILEKTAVPGNDTFNTYYAKANKFASLAAGDIKNFHAAVDSMGVYPHQMNVLESTSTYGSVENAKEITRWAFDNKPGKVSEIKTINGNFFFIVAVKDAHKEGYASVKEVAPSIKSMLMNEKLGEKKAAEVKEKMEGKNSLEEIAEALGTSVSSQNGLAFASMRAQGMDPAVIGAISAAPENQVTGPVTGKFGVYVFNVTGRDTGAFYTEDDAKNLSAQMSQYASQMIVPVMMEAADVVDHRERFY